MNFRRLSLSEAVGVLRSLGDPKLTLIKKSPNSKVRFYSITKGNKRHILQDNASAYEYIFYEDVPPDDVRSVIDALFSAHEIESL